MRKRKQQQHQWEDSGGGRGEMRSKMYGSEESRKEKQGEVFDCANLPLSLSARVLQSVSLNQIKLLLAGKHEPSFWRSWGSIMLIKVAMPCAPIQTRIDPLMVIDAR